MLGRSGGVVPPLPTSVASGLRLLMRLYCQTALACSRGDAGTCTVFGWRFDIRSSQSLLQFKVAPSDRVRLPAWSCAGLCLFNSEAWHTNSSLTSGPQDDLVLPPLIRELQHFMGRNTHRVA
eukprot:7036561-Alexandrium_andersonii.AAC.1